MIQEEISLVTATDGDTALLYDTINFSKPIEDYIRQYPSDWLWTHKRWKMVKD